MCSEGFFQSSFSLSLFAALGFVPPPAHYLQPVLGRKEGARAHITPQHWLLCHLGLY